MPDPNIYARLQSLMGWSHTELARRGGVTGPSARQTGYRWTRGARPFPDTRRRLHDEAVALRAALDELIPELDPDE